LATITRGAGGSASTLWRQFCRGKTFFVISMASADPRPPDAGAPSSSIFFCFPSKKSFARFFLLVYTLPPSQFHGGGTRFMQFL
jgi:hypothetical protein